MRQRYLPLTKGDVMTSCSVLTFNHGTRSSSIEIVQISKSRTQIAGRNKLNIKYSSWLPTFAIRSIIDTKPNNTTKTTYYLAPHHPLLQSSNNRLFTPHLEKNAFSLQDRGGALAGPASHATAWTMTFNSEKNCAIQGQVQKSIAGPPETTYPEAEDRWDLPEPINPALWQSVTAFQWDVGCVLEFWTQRDSIDNNDNPSLTIERTDKVVHDMGGSQSCVTGMSGTDPSQEGWLTHWRYNCKEVE
ncbi:hypothetical protein CC79DRAFT_183452 [Sarocladium strictum]